MDVVEKRQLFEAKSKLNTLILKDPQSLLDCHDYVTLKATPFLKCELDTLFLEYIIIESFKSNNRYLLGFFIGQCNNLSLTKYSINLLIDASEVFGINLGVYLSKHILEEEVLSRFYSKAPLTMISRYIGEGNIDIYDGHLLHILIDRIRSSSQNQSNEIISYLICNMEYKKLLKYPELEKLCKLRYRKLLVISECFGGTGLNLLQSRLAISEENQAA